MPQWMAVCNYSFFSIFRIETNVSTSLHCDTLCIQSLLRRFLCAMKETEISGSRVVIFYQLWELSWERDRRGLSSHLYWLRYVTVFSLSFFKAHIPLLHFILSLSLSHASVAFLSCGQIRGSFVFLSLVLFFLSFHVM